MLFGKTKKKVAKTDSPKTPTLADSVCLDDINTGSKFVTLEKSGDGIAVIVKAVDSNFVNHSIAMAINLLGRITPKSVVVIVGCEFRFTDEFDLLWSHLFSICTENKISVALIVEMKANTDDVEELRNLISQKM